LYVVVSRPTSDTTWATDAESLRIFLPRRVRWRPGRARDLSPAGVVVHDVNRYTAAVALTVTAVAAGCSTTPALGRRPGRPG
jgi:hypothetical protein